LAVFGVPEVDLASDAGRPGALIKQAQALRAENEKNLKIGEWNRYRIRAEGPRIRLWINDVLTVDYTEKDPKITLTGKIALQIHSGATEIRYRNLVNEELKAGRAMSIMKAYDVIVVGASPSGIAAAVAARREGASVVLVEELRRVGGMYTVGGMGLADCFFMDRRMLDGLCEEIHSQIGDHYRRQGITYRPVNFRDRFPKDQGRWYHEPKVAELVFTELLAKAGVDVITGQTVVSVGKSGSRIKVVRLTDGRVLGGPAFVDTTYTGDLMALAGVEHVVGREGRAAYGESLAGKQVIHGQRKVWKVDPRDAAGRLLPTVNTDDPGPTEEGDHKIQNYNFRLTLTDDPANSVAIPSPRRYDPARYELLRRYLLAHPDDARIKEPYPLPNRKFDWNDAQSVAFSHAIPGGSWDYPAADLPTRRRIEDDHREFTLGMLHFIRTDPSVPKRIRDSFARFGLPKDEHADTGHFPPMIYIREARRIVGEHVLTQHDIERDSKKPDAIGIGLAPITVHNVQRVAIAGGYYHEGAAHSPYEPHGKPYQIPYRAILPKRAQCENLLVPVCLSASHMAHGSIRVEPTWIVLGQSAGVAAALAAKGDSAIQDVPYTELRRRLLAGRQVLDIFPEPAP
ncbi:MAG: FAD-dependent oxidoreductase, partial [Planctomycetota bacterium]